MCINGFRTLPLNGVVLSEPSDNSVGLRIMDDDNFRTLLVRDIHGREAVACQLNLQQPDMPVQADKRELLASFLLVPAQGRSMILGMHNIGLIKFLRSFSPAQFIDVVDSDPHLIAAADTYFSLRPDDRLSIRQGGQLDYLLSRPVGAYDVIYMDQGFVDDDGYMHQGLSDDIRSEGVLSAVRERLNEQGLLVVELSGDRKQAERDIDSVIAVFPHVFAWEDPDGDGVMLAALKHRQIVNPLIFRERARKLDQKVSVGFSFTLFIDRLLAGEYRVMEI